MSAWTDKNEPEIVRCVIVAKINVNNVPVEDIHAYMEATSVKLTDQRLLRQGFMYYFIPIRDEPTTLTFVDLATMKSVTA